MPFMFYTAKTYSFTFLAEVKVTAKKPKLHNVVVTCEIKLFQNYFKIILFHV